MTNFLTTSSAEFVRDALREEVPFCSYTLTPEHSVHLLVSLWDQKSWPNTYVQNSPHCRVAVYRDGSVEVFSWNLDHGLWQKFRDEKFRKTRKFKAKDLPHLVARLRKHLSDVVSFRVKHTTKEAKA